MTDYQDALKQINYPTDIVSIGLTKGKYAIVDAIDYELVSQYNWYTQNANGVFYAASRIKGKIVLLHRFLLGLKFGDKRCGDHINHNTLDNRRENIRICTRQQNQQNRRVQSNCKSRLKGAYRCTGSKTWTSRINVNGKDIYLGTFKTKELAHKAYQQAAQKYFKEFCCV